MFLMICSAGEPWLAISCAKSAKEACAVGEVGGPRVGTRGRKMTMLVPLDHLALVWATTTRRIQWKHFSSDTFWARPWRKKPKSRCRSRSLSRSRGGKRRLTTTRAAARKTMPRTRPPRSGHMQVLSPRRLWAARFGRERGQTQPARGQGTSNQCLPQPGERTRFYNFP